MWRSLAATPFVGLQISTLPTTLPTLQKIYLPAVTPEMFSNNFKPLDLAMKHILTSLLCCVALLMISGLSGCSKEPIRYLSSEACLVTPGTSHADVLSYMGAPDIKEQTDTGETWIYIEKHKSLLKKTLSSSGSSAPPPTTWSTSPLPAM